MATVGQRITPAEEKALLEVAAPHLQPLIIIALDAGLRRGEMLAMTWADVDSRPRWLRLRGETTKSGKAAFRQIDLRWHDLRHEYASRLVERGVPLSQVRDLLGHASIVTTERYDNQTDAALLASARLLDTGETFKILSRSDVERPADVLPALAPEDAKLLETLKMKNGVGNGVRTRDFRSHSPALYR